MTDRAKALDELVQIAQDMGMYTPNNAHRLHLCNKMNYVDMDSGVLHLLWRVVAEDGTVLSRWTHFEGAEMMRGKMIAKRHILGL